METTTSIEGRCRSRRRRSVGWKPGLRAWLASIAAVLMIASSSVAADPRAFSVELLFDGEAVSLGKVWRGPGTPESDRGFVEDRLPQGSLYYVVYGGGGEGLDATDPWKLGAPVLAKGLLGDPCLRVVEMYDQNTGTWKGQTLRGAKGRTLVRVGEKPVPERLVVYRREARDRTDRKPPRVLLNATLSDGGRPGTSFPSNVVHGGSATSNKIGIVLLGDGFLSADLAAGGTYDQLCKKFGQTLLETEPFASYGHLLRIVRVDVPSNGVGIGMQGAVPVDNFFGTILTQTPDEAAPAASGDEGGDWRWARLADTGIEKALQVNPDVPRAVAVVVLNDASISAEVRGGGGPCPVVAVTTRAPGPQFLHGLGHALGMLGDEMGGPAACPGTSLTVGP